MQRYVMTVISFIGKVSRSVDMANTISATRIAYCNTCLDLHVHDEM